MDFTVLTIFPEMFAPLRESILKRAGEAGHISVRLVNFREYAVSKHKNVDDVPFGGGSGMVLKPEPIYAAVRDLPPAEGRRKILLMTPQGKLFNQEMGKKLARADELVILCGHYEGYDERIRSLADEEISIGDYVLTGGELAAMVIIDAVSRHLPGVLGKADSSVDDSLTEGLLEYPQYTRPPDFEGMRVPDILLSGHHANIQRWRRKEAIRRTFLRRPDLSLTAKFCSADYELLEELAGETEAIAEARPKWEHLKPPSKKALRQRKTEKS
ncbi:tRNA (Guanine37-N(1)-) methyltransferase [Syntrophobotulus glycolicus DSM 8271]|uniref:tRNA (guanine-N(1)-)-methyltransferase n=1 Tax=Syntrophobotulus glycolicus (strain DSM 8271 / FlGlyR) TaxID=645991 RepID=F0SUE0_SYNGF|nr:tRNA (guanosine(37)-N1)-methyltransferase TrmD [Syntrophobotulus glycolicus]ADY56590.1 tRNA (Guanine37-N(1)-) methyltransferase [Syntrophobotulus glycolicus DSM 8271]